MKFQELTNEEIVFIYLRQEKFIEVHNDLIKQGEELMQLSPSELDMGDELLIKNLTRMKQSEHIKLLDSINNKLYPIVDLIEDADPRLYQRINDIIESPMMDSDEEEDDDQ